MLTNKPIINKFYLYKTKLVKVKKIYKSSSSVLVTFIENGETEAVPTSGADLLLVRLYTIGEVAKITSKRPDTIRKYEKKGLIPKPSYSSDEGFSYKNWRFYTQDDVYDVVQFFSGRTPGRPITQPPVSLKSSIGLIKQKVNNL